MGVTRQDFEIASLLSHGLLQTFADILILSQFKLKLVRNEYIHLTYFIVSFYISLFSALSHTQLSILHTLRAILTLYPQLKHRHTIISLTHFI